MYFIVGPKHFSQNLPGSLIVLAHLTTNLLIAGLFDAYPQASSTKMINGLFDAYSLLKIGPYKPSSIVVKESLVQSVSFTRFFFQKATWSV